jgi:hypothetical protein
MNKLANTLAASIFGVSLVASADVLDFNTTAVGVSGNAVPLLSASLPASPGGFVDETFTYKGFTFEYQTLAPPVPANHAWIWLTEGSSFGGLGDRYNSAPLNPSNGFLAHGCLDTGCSAVSSRSFAISNPTPFTFQSLDISRYSGDTASINLYTNIGDLVPARTIVAPVNPNLYIPMTVVNTLYSTEVFTKITIDGFKGYYGVDNIVYAPIPEASTYSMMIAGLGALGYFARRRKAA